MMTLVTTTQFRKDYKRVKKRGCDMALLENVIDTLLAGETLDPQYRDHALSGRLNGYRECPILPDRLLRCATDGERLILAAAGTGTHSDLFDE